MAKEPVKRLQNYLVANGWWDEVQEQAWLNEVQQIIQDQVDTYLNMDTQPVESIFDYLYAELPKALQEQRTSATIKAMTGGSHHES
nr:thiamine pyrophosphate-dependent enzyme [Aliamphritea spongicola]